MIHIKRMLIGLAIAVGLTLLSLVVVCVLKWTGSFVGDISDEFIIGIIVTWELFIAYCIGYAFVKKR